jgi:hypothetical protein
MSILRRPALVVGLFLLEGVKPAIAQTDRNDDIGVYTAAAKAVLYAKRDSLIVMSVATKPSLGSFMVSSRDIVPASEVDSSTAIDFRRANAMRRPVPPLEIEGVTILSVPDSVIQVLGQESRDAVAPRITPVDYWQDFHRRFIGAIGLLSVSGIGYRHDGREAVVVVGFGCGGLCGQGKVLVLHKQDGVWVVTKQLGGWRV